MFNEFLFIRSLKMSWKDLSCYRLHFWFASLRSISDLKGFILFLVHCFKIKWLRFIMINPIILLYKLYLLYATCSGTYLWYHLLLPFQFFHLVFSKTIFVVWISFEWQGIKGILWRLFMINIMFAIKPIREFCLITAFLLTGSVVLFGFSFFFLWWLNQVRLELWFVSCSHFHFVRINYFMFFFYVKCILLRYLLSLSLFHLILLLIIRY